VPVALRCRAAQLWG
jgi:hypothetical protein